MSRQSALILVLLLLSVLCGSVRAASERQGARSDQPIQIKANELSTDNSGRTATFLGAVTARQGELSILCDRLVVNYGDREREVTRVEAYGNVRIMQGNRRAQAGRAIYDNRVGTIILEENPRVYQGADMVTGKVITFYLNEQKSMVTGGPDRRVEAVINPKGAGNDGGNKP